MTTEEWGQVMMVLQGGIYRVVAPLLNKISFQVQIFVSAQMEAQKAGVGPKLVVSDSEEVNAISNPLSAAE